jgi:tripartite-type tricarboxylate transporter receptor subunit TctC
MGASMFKRLLNLPALCAAAAVAAAGVAHAQAWPAKPIRLVVPYAAGGPGDVIARIVAKKAGEILNQTIVVDNKGGAGGTIGVDAALKSPPDGYTFALTAQGPLAGMPNLTKVPYALGDVQYLTLVARGPAVVAIAKKVPADNLAELIKLAKSQPGKLNYGSAGPGTTPHIAAELLKQEAGIEMTHVPYKGAGPAVTGLLGGEIDLAVVDLLNVLPHVAAGSLKVLAVASPTRAPQLPNVPTTKEAGLANVVMDTTYGVIAPSGVPADVQKKFRDAIVAAVQSADLNEQMLKQGVVPLTATPQEYKAAMQAEFDKWKRVITAARITLE